MWLLGGQTESFQKCRGVKGVYNVLTFQKTRGARAHLWGGSNAPPAPLNETLTMYSMCTCIASDIVLVGIEHTLDTRADLQHHCSMGASGLHLAWGTGEWESTDYECHWTSETTITGRVAFRGGRGAFAPP